MRNYWKPSFNVFIMTPLDSFREDPVSQLEVGTGAGRTLERDSTEASIMWPDD